MKQQFVIGEDAVEAALIRRGGSLLLGEAEIPVALEPAGDGGFTLRAGNRSAHVFVARQGDETFVHLDGEAFTIRWQDPVDRLGHAGGGQEDTASAPMPGVVISVAVAPGQAVHKGEALMVIESMKLQTTISAWRDGTVQTLHCAVNQPFDRGAALVSLEPALGEAR